jgi:single-stranded DNA-binding protein
VEGRLQSRSWEDNAGQKRNTIEVRAERVQFLTSASKESAAAHESEHTTGEAPNTESEWLEESEDKSHERG